MKKVLVITTVCLLAGMASAGVWNVTNNDDLGAGLDTSFGTLFQATNLGESSNVTSVTVSSIAFDTDQSNVTGVNTTSGSYGGADADTANLLGFGKKVSQWGGGSEITLSGLTPGYDYQVQLLLSGSWGGCSANLYVDEADYQYVYFGSSATERVATYEFTASTTSVVMNNWSNQGDYNVKGYAVHEAIPEPATFGLMGIAGAGILFVRRKTSV